MKRFILIIALLAIGIQSVAAADFSSVSPSGHTLYYNIIDADSNYVSTTYPGATGGLGWNGYTKPTGNVIIPSTVTNNNITYTVREIGDYSFLVCTNINAVSIPNTIIRVGCSAFNGCNIANLTIPNSVKIIELLAFNCNVQTINGGDSVYFIGERAFGNYNATSQPSGIVYIGNVVYQYRGTASNNTHITIPEGVVGIAEKAFFQQSNITSVTLPQTLLAIGDNAFGECGGITSITIPANVVLLGAKAFCSCGNLASVHFNARRTKIHRGSLTGFSGSGHNDVFYACHNLTSFTIGDSVEIIPDGAFNGMQHVSTILFPPSIKYIGTYSFTGCSSLSSINIPENVEYLGIAFGSCSNLSTVQYNAINCSTSYAPFSYTALTNLTIGSSVRIIPQDIFSSCSNISGHLIIPNSVEFIGKQAFYNCSGITELTIGTSVDSMGSMAFYGMSSLNTVHYNATNCSVASGFGGANLSHFYIGSNVISLPGGIVANAPNLTSVEFPNTLSRIGNSNFYSCGLSGVVTLPSSLSYIGSHAFSNCQSITEVRCLATDPPSSEDYIFYGEWNVPLLVPCHNIETYQNAVGWRNFTNIQGLPGCVTITTISNNESYGTVEGGGSYDIGDQVTLTATPFTGYRFDHWQDNNVQNPRTITITGNATYTAYFVATQGIDDVIAEDVNVSTLDGQIVVETELKDEISIYDIVGRKVDCGHKTRFNVPAPGVYLVRMGSLPTQKVVVVK